MEIGKIPYFFFLFEPLPKQPASGPPYVLISSSGPAADHQGEFFGLYRKIEEMREGRSVYLQEQDTEYTDSLGKMFSA